MIKSRDINGFTLIEIIVVLLISSIVMTIAGSMILNSLDFFNKETRSDIDKLAVDSIASLVRDELTYASDVKITVPGDETIEGEDWRSFSVLDGKLYLDDVLLFENGFYNHRDLIVEVTGYREGYRMNLKFSFANKDSREVVYQTSSTLEMLNIKERVKVDENYHPFPVSAVYQVGKDGYRIYYKKGDVPENSMGSIVNLTGSVKDELNCRDSEVTEPGDIAGNFKGEFARSTKYKYGEFVFFSGSFYRCVSEDGLETNTIINTPLGMKGWKKMNTDWKDSSAYQTGDVVLYNYKPYKCLKGIDSSDSDKNKIVGGVIYTGTEKQPSLDGSTNKYWKAMSKEELDTEIKNHSDSSFCEIRTGDYWTVGGEKKRCGTAGNVKIWNNPSLGIVLYQPGDFVQYQGKWYRTYKSSSNKEMQTEDFTNDNWKWIQTIWNEHTRYNKNDIVLFDGKYYRAAAGYLTSIDIPGKSVKWDGGGTSGSSGAGYDNVEDIIKKIEDKESNYAYPSCDIGG